MDNYSNYRVVENGEIVYEGNYLNCQTMALYGCDNPQMFKVLENGTIVEVTDWI